MNLELCIFDIKKDVYHISILTGDGRLNLSIDQSHKLLLVSLIILDFSFDLRAIKWMVLFSIRNNGFNISTDIALKFNLGNFNK